MVRANLRPPGSISLGDGRVGATPSGPSVRHDYGEDALAMKRREVPFWALAALALVVWHGSAAVAQKRFIAPRPPAPQAVDSLSPDAEALLDGVFLPPDRKAKQNLEKARADLHSSAPEYTDSVAYLGMVLESSE